MRTKIVIIAIILLSAISIKAQDFDFEDSMLKGKAALDSGQYELAIKYLEPCEKFASQDTTKMMQEIDNILLSIMAESHAKLGNYKKTVELFTRVLNNKKQLLGEFHPDYATTLNKLANCYHYLGDYTAAVELGTQALEIRKRVLGETHPDYANSLSNLANSYSNLVTMPRLLNLARKRWRFISKF